MERALNLTFVVGARTAQDLWQQGLDLHYQGDFGEAIGCYERSLGIHQSAEAHTFLGWSRASQGHLDEAIEHCRRALATDPSFGNPYNDIGAYLVELGRPDEAYPWFERAKQALRYDTPHFPYLNLARLWILAGRMDRASLELQTAGLLAPEDPRIPELLGEIGARLDARGEQEAA